MACLVLRPFLGFSAVIVAEGVMGSAFDFSRRAFPCAFALLMLSYDPRAATTVENPTRSALVLGSLVDSPVESFSSPISCTHCIFANNAITNTNFSSMTRTSPPPVYTPSCLAFMSGTFEKF